MALRNDSYVAADGTSGVLIDGVTPAYTTDGSGATGSRLIKQVYSNKILKKFYEKVIYAAISNTDYEGEIKGAGDKVFIRHAPEVSIVDHSVGDKIQYEELDSVAKELVIDQAKRWAFKMYDEDEHQIDINLANLATENAATQLQIKVEKDVFQYMAENASPLNSGAYAGAESGVGGAIGKVGAADTANTSGGIDLGSAGAAIKIVTESPEAGQYTGLEAIVYLNQILDEQNVPNEGRWVVIPSWFASRLKLGDLKRADVTGDGTGVIRTGLLGKIDRTLVYQSNNLYTAMGTETTPLKHTFVLAGLNMATTFAAQITKSSRLEIQDQFGWFYRGMLAYGRAVTVPAALAVLECKL